ncbi:hypothetical protein F444_11295 [Phytophthora nicotianae P1976]|uniref:Uncharacterized protein n=1 Tax=Phytophthora nicotianae P1976 TaxID=1317066 RepID=A0A081A1C3_PHYNI|nr:hypothetical protein F444_11295 [Phytophthora nicotianae P1976]
MSSKPVYFVAGGRQQHLDEDGEHDSAHVDILLLRADEHGRGGDHGGESAAVETETSVETKVEESRLATASAARRPWRPALPPASRDHPGAGGVHGKKKKPPGLLIADKRFAFKPQSF